MKTNPTMASGKEGYEQLYLDADKRFKPFLKFMKLSSLKNKRVLDDGCGCGWLTDYLQKKAKNNDFYGIDPFEEDIEYGKKKNKNIKYMMENGENLPFKDNYFDYLISHEILEHVKNPYKYVKEMSRVLKPNSFAFFSTPNKFFPYEFHYRVPLINLLPGFLFSKFVKLYSKRYVKKLLSKYNFKIEHDIVVELVKDPSEVFFQRKFLNILHTFYNLSKRLKVDNIYIRLLSSVLPQKYIIKKIK